MTWWVIAVEALVFAGIFTAIIFTYYHGNRKYSPTSIHNYPPDIQEEYFEMHEKIDVSPIFQRGINSVSGSYPKTDC